jgi:hypothetical protein
MRKVGQIALAVLRFLGISALIDVGLLILVSLSCLIWGPCSNAQYSERMFWVGLGGMIAAMPAVLAALGTSRGYYDNPFTAGIDAQVAQTIIKDGRRGLSKRTAFAWRMISIGAIGIGIAALIDTLG